MALGGINPVAYPSPADGPNLIGYGDALAADSPDGTTGTTAATPPDFAAAMAPMRPTAPAVGTDSIGTVLTQGLDYLQQVQATADNLSVQAATGRLTDVHDYMIAATEASLATELTVAIRNKAVDAFNEIMRMQA